MAYNLTENQKELARRIVQDIRNGIQQEEFIFTQQGAVLLGPTGADPDHIIVTEGNIQELCNEGMLRLLFESSGRVIVAVKGRLYEAVDTDFGAASTERPSSTMSEYDLTEYQKEILRLLVENARTDGRLGDEVWITFLSHETKIEDFEGDPPPFSRDVLKIFARNGLMECHPFRGMPDQYKCTLGKKAYIAVDTDFGAKTKPEHPQAETPDSTEIDIFISHSSNDDDLGTLLVDLLQSAFTHGPEILYTSKDELGLEPGAQVDPSLKKNIQQSKVFVGLLTPNSLESVYVLFELGARWGSSDDILLVRARGASKDKFVGPLQQINPTDGTRSASIQTLLEKLEKSLGRKLKKTSKYQDKIDKFTRAAATTVDAGPEKREPLAESLKGPVEDLHLVLDRFVDQQGALQLLLDNQGGEVTDVEIVPAWNVECVIHQRTTRWPRLVGTIVFKHNPPPPKRPVPLVQFSFAIMYTDSAGQDWTKQYVVRIDRSHLNKSYVREEKEHKVMGRQRDHINQIIKPPKADSTEALPINDFQHGMRIAQALGASENEIASVYLQEKFPVYNGFC